jgi:hypothetical protein
MPSALLRTYNPLILNNKGVKLARSCDEKPLACCHSFSKASVPKKSAETKEGPPIGVPRPIASAPSSFRAEQGFE